MAEVNPVPDGEAAVCQVGHLFMPHGAKVVFALMVQ